MTWNGTFQYWSKTVSVQKYVCLHLFAASCVHSVFAKINTKQTKIPTLLSPKVGNPMLFAFFATGRCYIFEASSVEQEVRQRRRPASAGATVVTARIWYLSNAWHGSDLPTVGKIKLKDRDAMNEQGEEWINIGV
jgi:hypothetical protein